MKATEFRIGNKVEYKGRVVALEAEDFPQLQEYIEDGKLKPIPLTKESIKRFDVKILNTNEHIYYSVEINNLYIYFNTLGNSGVVIDSVECDVCNNLVEDIDVISKIEYIHQLQNLYFILSGDELPEVDTTEIFA